MVTYENLFMFISMLTSVISVVVLVVKQKKMKPRLDQKTAVSL